MSLYRCSACGSPNVVTDTQKGGYSYVKGAIGAAVLGVGGAVAGIDGKNSTVYECPDCGLTMNKPMPLEIQTLIDIGVMDAKARENLILAGVKIKWEELKSRYKNIESGFADKSILEKNSNAEKILFEYAKATQEEFDWAADILSEASWFPSKSEDITKDTRGNIIKALNIFVENMYKYIPSKMISLASFKYRGKLYYIDDLFFAYLAYCSYNQTGTFLVLSEKKEEFSTNNSFVKAFVQVYSEKGGDYFKDNGCWGRFVEEYNQLVESVWLYGESWSNHTCWSVLIPRFAIKNNKLGCLKNYRGFLKFGEIKEQYFKIFPEKKKEYDDAVRHFEQLKKRDDQLLQASRKRGELEKNIKEKQEYRRIDEQKVVALETENVKLGQKRFFKSFYKKKIDEINASILKINEEIKALKNAEQRIKEEIKKIDNNKKERNEIKKEIEKQRFLILEICKNMKWCAIWDWIEE